MDLAGFRNCLAEYTMHTLSPCYGLLTTLVVLNSVARWCNTAQFLQKWCNLYAGVHGRRKDFIQGGTSGFFQTFFHRWPKVVKFGCFHSHLKTALFAEIFNFLPPSDTHACV